MHIISSESYRCEYCTESRNLDTKELRIAHTVTRGNLHSVFELSPVPQWKHRLPHLPGLYPSIPLDDVISPLRREPLLRAMTFCLGFLDANIYKSSRCYSDKYQAPKTH